MKRSFPHFFQNEEADCGPTCLRMILDFYGKSTTLLRIKNECPMDRGGVTLKGLSLAAETFGLRTNGVRVPFKGTDSEAGLLDVNLPCIAYWNLKHYLVVYKVSKDHVWIADPSLGKKRLTRAEFEEGWRVNDGQGILLLLEPTPDFFATTEEKNETRRFSLVFDYLAQYKSLMLQLAVGLFISSGFALILPFLTQMIVDKGIVNHDINLINMVLISQILIFVAATSISFIQAWIFLHIGARINISLVHDFLIKLMKLSIGFFNNRTVGDLLKRIDDHARINSFITGSSLSIVFSFLNVIVFSFVLLLYSFKLFLVYWFFSLLYILWIVSFLKKRRELDHMFFEAAAANQSKLLEIINGIQEIKLQGSEKKRRWQWVNLQAKIFKISSRSLLISQVQGSGAGFLNQLKNILISFIAATSVINGEISLGMMLAVQFIIGYINAPLESAIGFVRSAQDARISFDRLNEIHVQADEETGTEEKFSFDADGRSIKLTNVSFRYSREAGPVLNDISLEIAAGKITAIVGNSGSGKTTLLKLLLGFYQPTGGVIRVGKQDINHIKLVEWRSQCGAVLQDGFIFPDTIAHNICESDDYVDNRKLAYASHIANIDEFSDKLHAGFNTVVGANGINLSKGQVQRILIARAVYKNPAFFFFDEATNSLDATNERLIMDNLATFCAGKTVVVVAHRLSTVRNADKIVVLKNGSIAEQGTHSELTAMKGHYFELVNNQIELEIEARNQPLRT